MQRRAFLAAIGGGSLAALAGCTAVASLTESHDVGMSAHEFLPDTYTVEVGDTVIWENTGSRAHTITAYDGGQPDGAAFFSTGAFEGENAARKAWYDDREGSIYTGDRFEHTFEVSGEHNYYCIPHERGGMVGRIVVEK
ncbi:cupredoxin domain-containing protein [Halalkalicoccus jeotgali]|uniref:Blue (Type 1) copper domain protein n=1 Tax=Halalkalicoccus jeotgali (strain DSM 18796 / CECT 7217 / JCM 14584 / KCTC 4019 / B3) TaxID=795797 RepID=D8J4T0_HALJB|nr:plastocyanin/azurin family copper-binding protein [Halalkalicoccus jeotgali]ADJ15547.1 blue (type 1) copper domain protein [Halalkalicoccus jeotgali B3]ELY36044.1 blue (type 1) copper domain-containing protein [Halalkalicoccus jeotgali B3]